MGLNWELLVSQRNDWVVYNFPDQAGRRTPLDSVLGCIEELGELVHHHLKQVQSIRGSDDHHETGAKDAIGDCTVYLLGVMGHYGVRPMVYSHFPNLLSADKELLRLAKWVGRLAGNEVDWEDRQQAQTVVDGIVATLMRVCLSRGWNYEAIVRETWEDVRKRDWIKYPDTGFPPPGTEENPLKVRMGQ